MHWTGESPQCSRLLHSIFASLRLLWLPTLWPWAGEKQIIFGIILWKKAQVIPHAARTIYFLHRLTIFAKLCNTISCWGRAASLVCFELRRWNSRACQCQFFIISAHFYLSTFRYFASNRPIKAGCPSQAVTATAQRKLSTSTWKDM